MKILVVCKEHHGKKSPFVTEQIIALQKLGISVELYGITGHGISGYLGNLGRINRIINTFHPDIIHAHYGLSGLCANLQRKVPVVTTFHNGETLSFTANLLSSIGAAMAQHVIYVAKHIRQLSFYKAKRYSIVPCGICLDDCKIIPFEEARKRLGFEDGKKYILFGGAFDNLRKNYPLLREAVGLLKTKADVTCLEMKGLSRAECVLRMCACDVFALPSKSEGSPQALKEAMACNCPIVATDVADIRHLLGDIDGHYICSFEPKDVASKIAKAFSYGKRTNGRQRIIDLGLTNDLVAKRLITIYKAVTK